VLLFILDIVKNNADCVILSVIMPKSIVFPVLCLSLALVSCAGPEVAATPTPMLSLEEIVLQTLEAYALEMDITLQPADLAEAPGEVHSVEVTQMPLEPTATFPAEVIEEPTPTPPAEIPAEPAPVGEIPDSYYIWNIWGHRQYFPIGCEASAANDWAWYFGVAINEFDFQMQLPVSDNPDLGFVGSVEGPWGQVPPYAYGVHAAPVAQVLRDNYGMNAQAARGFTIEQIKAEVASGQPVIAWVIGNVVGGIPYEYTDSQGNTVIVAAYEHVVIVTGYNEETIRYMNNGKFYDIQFEYFENSWSVLGNMVLYMGD
jgi:uncharacterized protein YvpB